MKRCIVNFAADSWYPAGQARLGRSLQEVAFDGDFLSYHPGSLNCPSHQEVNYGFKAYGLLEAVKQDYDLILWCDSSCWAIKPLDTIFAKIEEQGYLFIDNPGQRTGQWSTDQCLASFSLDREESLKLPMLMSGFMGFNMKRFSSHSFLLQFFSKMAEGCFNGAWTNRDQSCSADPRVLGHRHDQTVASLLALKLGMTNWATPHQDYFTVATQQLATAGDSVAVLACGM